MTSIVTSDWHLTDKPADEYRWGLFEWLKQQKADEVVICGDICDRKDKHAAVFVNRFVDEIDRLSQSFDKVIILMGNHDGFSPQHPFFEFVGRHPKVEYIKEPKIVELSIGKATFIPAGVSWNFTFHDFPFIFTHATFNGALAENGTSLTGIDPSVLDGYKGTVYSGDIHVPQEMFSGKLIYIGAPYHTRFGDSYKPRILLLDEDTDQDLFYPAPRKPVFFITQPDDLYDEKVNKGDYVKVKCHLLRADYPSWKSYKERIHEIAEELGWVLCGVELVPFEVTKKENVEEEDIESKSISVANLVEDYAIRHKAPQDYIDIGKGLVEV